MLKSSFLNIAPCPKFIYNQQKTSLYGRSFLKILKIFQIFLLLGGLTACQSSRDPETMTPEEKQDPFEPFNRKVFEFNRVVDGLILEPFSNLYKMTVNEDIQRGIANFLYNLAEPVTLANDCLQAKGERGLETFSRFMINTTFGLFGLFDVAGKLGMPRHQEDFGQTLATWGVPSGPYLVMPFIGSSTPRSLAGRFTDFYLSPYNYYMIHYNRRQYIYMRLAADTIVKRARYADDIKNFRENSIDFYAAVRSFYLQNRKAEVQDGEVEAEDAPGADEFSFDDDDDFLED